MSTYYPINAKYIKGSFRIEFGQYFGSRATAIQLFTETGELEATATVNLPDQLLAPGNVFIKSYSENEELLDSLIVNGIVGEPVRTVKAGFAEVYECPLLIESY